MKQCLITFDQSSNTFDVFSGAKGRGFPLTSEVVMKKEFVLEVLEKIIQEGIDQGYKVNLSTELETMRNNKILENLKSKEQAIKDFISNNKEKPQTKFRNYRFEGKEETT